MLSNAFLNAAKTDMSSYIRSVLGTLKILFWDLEILFFFFSLRITIMKGCILSQYLKDAARSYTKIFLGTLFTDRMKPEDQEKLIKSLQEQFITLQYL